MLVYNSDSNIVIINSIVINQSMRLHVSPSAILLYFTYITVYIYFILCIYTHFVYILSTFVSVLCTYVIYITNAKLMHKSTHDRPLTGVHWPIHRGWCRGSGAKCDLSTSTVLYGCPEL